MASPDLSKLSDADLAALQAGDMSKVSDEGLSHLSGVPQQPLNPGPLERMVQGVRPGVSSPAAIQNAQTENKGTTQRALDTVTSGFAPGGMGGAPKTVGGAVDSLTDYLARKGIGLPQTGKATGLGNRALDMGMWGTKGGMLKQAESTLPVVGEAMGKAAAETPTVSKQTALTKLDEFISKFKNPESGAPLMGMEKQAQDLSKMRRAVENIPTSGASYGKEVAGLGKQASQQGAYANKFGMGTPQMAQEAENLSGTREALSSALKEASPAYAKEASNYEALKESQKALGNKPGISVRDVLGYTVPVKGQVRAATDLATSAPVTTGVAKGIRSLKGVVPENLRVYPKPEEPSEP